LAFKKTGIPLRNPLAALALSMMFAALLAGCAAPPMALSPQAHKAIDSVHTVLFVPQNNLDVDVTPGNPGATGLLGALIVQAIDESRRATAQKAQVTVVDAVNGFDFRTRMSNQLNAEFGRVQSVRLQTPVQLETIDSDSQRHIAFDRSPASAVLFTRVSYKLIEGKLVVSSVNLMYPKARALMHLRTKPNDGNPLDDGNVIYRRTFTFVRQAVTRDNVREGLADGLSNVAWQLAADLNHMGPGTTANLAAPLGHAPAGDAPPSTPATIAAAQQAMARANAQPRQNPDGSPVRPAQRPDGSPVRAARAQPETAQPPRSEPRPEPAAPQNAKLEDADAVPYLTERGREAYRNWLTRPLPRAFAVSAEGIWSTTWSRTPANPAMPADPVQRALLQCNARSKEECRLYAVDRAVVWDKGVPAADATR
jgi:hypothetical protein